MEDPKTSPLRWVQGSPVGSRFRRPLTDDELERIRSARSSSRDDTDAAFIAFVALWDILLGEAEGLTFADARAHTAATGERFDIRSYAVPYEQSATIFEILHGDLTGRSSKWVGVLWVDLGPAGYEP